LALVPFFAPTASSALTAAEQHCLNVQNALVARLVTAQHAAASACIAHAQRGRTARLANGGETVTAQACLRNDVRGRVAAAAKRLAAKGTSVCVEKLSAPPAFGYGTPASLTPVVLEAMIALEADLFGEDLDAALRSDREGDPARDPGGARCQREVARAMHATSVTMWQEALVAERLALKGRTIGPAESAADLAEEIRDYFALRSRPIVREIVDLVETVVERCITPITPPRAEISALFPGCSILGEEPPSQTLISCVSRSARCRWCQSMVAAAQLPLDCDWEDDVSDNRSCETPPFESLPSSAEFESSNTR
jgi:hypothetical protein